ncbi:electron transfer flavoprotein subunit alpha/FixB family protein [Haloarcula marismortui]|uniref:Electron transfer flavoprotein subunit alpha n=2 Tax=Haloarcula marismortui TaxID=2238 RepID=M0JW43_9EURY|nr:MULTISPECIES: electron transfer flavoprotein subunit alpha/FixB family protein [Haloarcula]EMA12598.1 electron transfer flavoprotein subunit alpha [Haloarcula sinaiiensis ATCC 33800]EMA21850.1 electron transfer flavoprotein subunit alpha [Haloarcula californiae ATCC 33799]QUJ70918.1 electron transfer flavoprotein subunit alpha/FixB family protein [Haloarcula sinaiiensis ATCC 33800]
MPDIDPTEHEIAELGPKIKDVDDADELQAMLALEEDGEDRVPVKTLIKDRIEKVESDDDGEIDPEAVDLSDLTVADVANMVRDVDDADVLRDLLEREKAGQDRKTAKSQIESRIESVEGTEEAEGEAVTEVEYVPPEEKYPELDHPTNDKQWVEGTVGAEYRDMWVYCETQAGDLVDVSKEMLGKARELMNDYNAAYDEDERVVAVLIGADASDHVEDVIAYGADLVVYHEDDRLDRFRHQPYTEIFCDMARAGGDLAADGREETEWKDYHEPRYTVFPATNNGRDLSALVQGELDSGLASDCSGLYIESAMISNPAKVGTAGDKKEFERVLHMKRPDFSGFEYSTILCIDKPHRDFHPQGASVIPGSFEMPDPDYERDGEVVDYEMDLDDDWFTVEVEEYDRLSGGVDLSGHDVIVAVGRGIGDDPTRGIERALDLVDAFDDADLGLSRGVITSSYSFDGHVEQYVTEERQIGESGQEVEPDVYIAAGISGAIQHKVGCDESDTLIAVNTDPDADIRDFSDYLIEGDLFEVLPRLTEAVEAGELGAMMEASDD